MLPIDPIRTPRRFTAHDNIAVRIYGVAAIDFHSTGQNLLKEPEQREYVGHILMDRDAVPFPAQGVSTLMYADGPTPLSETDGGNQASETGPNYLRMARMDHLCRSPSSDINNCTKPLAR